MGQDVTLSCGVMATPTISELTLSPAPRPVEDTANVVMTTDTFTITDVVHAQKLQCFWVSRSNN